MADQLEQQWRTGRHPTDEPGPRQRTIYGPDGELRGAMFTTADERLVVDSLNEVTRLRGLLLRAGTALLAAMHGQRVDDAVLGDIEAALPAGIAREAGDG